MTAPVTRAVVKALTADGADVRFVGGCVRDALLGRESADIDIGTPDPPERVMGLLEGAGIETRTVPRGIAHGTVTAVAGGNRYEITTLRRDERPTAAMPRSRLPTTGVRTRRAATSPSMP